MSLSIELLASKQHDRSSFACGEESLDDYIKLRASQELKKAVSTSFVLLEPPAKTVLGYYCLSSYSIDISNLDEPIAKGLPRYPLLPATLIGRLAVDVSTQGKGYGGLLLADAMKRALAASRQVASVAVVVDAIDRKAVEFYLKYGFKVFPRIPMKLYISMESIEESI
jgi:GNAT superfamily N-acetyltransferase